MYNRKRQLNKIYINIYCEYALYNVFFTQNIPGVISTTEDKFLINKVFSREC